MENQINVGDQNAQQIGQNTVEQPVSTPEKPKVNYLVIGLVILICFVLFGFGGYYLGKQPTKITQNTSLNLAQSTPTPAVLVDPMINWKTYKNGVFEFKYPTLLPDIKLRTKNFGEESSPNISESSYLDPNQKGGGPGYSLLLRVIGPESNPKILSIEKWIENQGLNTGGYGDQLPRTMKPVMVDSKNAILQTGIPVGFSVPTEFNLYIASGNNIYTVVYTLQVNEEDAKKYQNDFDQILSTFKFLGNDNTETPSAVVPKANLVSKVGWLNVSATTYSLVYPPEYNPFSSGDMINFRHTQNPEQVAVFSVSRVGDPQSAKPYSVYSGGSRREWWIRANYDDSHPQPANLRFVEKTMGEINGLEVYEGDYFRSILVAKNDKLYMVEGQTEIINVSILETVVSTIKFK